MRGEISRKHEATRRRNKYTYSDRLYVYISCIIHISCATTKVRLHFALLTSNLYYYAPLNDGLE